MGLLGRVFGGVESIRCWRLSALAGGARCRHDGTRSPGVQSARGRGRADSGRSLSVEPFEGSLPPALSVSPGLSAPFVARRVRGRVSHGVYAWRLLRGLLLGADGGALRRGIDESGLDGSLGSRHLRRKALSPWSAHWKGGGPRPCPLWP